MNGTRYVYFAEGPKQALGYGLGSASQYDLRPAPLLLALLNVYVNIGLGSVISPLVCQSIIATGVPWYRFYYGSLLLSVFNIVFLYITFKPTFGERDREHQKALYEIESRQKLQRSRFSSPTSEYPAALESKTNLYLDTKSRSSEFYIISPLKINSFAYSTAPRSCDAISVGSLLFRPSL